MRATVLAIIVFATSIRIREAAQLTLTNLTELSDNGNVLAHIHRKSEGRTASLVFLRPEYKTDLNMAIDLMRKHRIVFNASSSTKFEDFRSISTDLNIGKLTSHMLRHQAATDMYNEGKPVEYIKQFMNHKHTKSTQEYLQKYAIVPSFAKN
jgi:integrase